MDAARRHALIPVKAKRPPGQLDVGERAVVSHDGRWLATLTGEGPVIWEFATGRIVAQVKLPRARAVDFDSSVRRLFCAIDNSLFAVELPERIGGLISDPQRVFGGENTLVIARDRGDLQLWSLSVLNAELGKIGLSW